MPATARRWSRRPSTSWPSERQRGPDRPAASTCSARPAARSWSSAVPLGDGHRSVGALVVIEDVSERRRLEAVRRDFVANISHELKTPVGALGLLAETSWARTTRRSPAAWPSAWWPRRSGWAAPSTTCSSCQPHRGRARRPVREPVPVHLVLAEAVERIRPRRRAPRHRHRGAGARPRRPQRDGRPPPAGVGRVQPARQRGEVLRAAGSHRARSGRRCRRRRPSSSTVARPRASASPAATSSGSSSASTGSTGPAAATPAAPASAWPSSATSPANHDGEVAVESHGGRRARRSRCVLPGRTPTAAGDRSIDSRGQEAA